MPKTKKKNVKARVRDLKPKKDAKGGRVYLGSTSTGSHLSAPTGSAQRIFR